MLTIMRTMSKALGCTAILASAVFSNSLRAESPDTWKEVRQSGVLRCGVAPSPPYVMRDPKTGNYSGIFPDLCRSFAEKLSVKPQFVDTNWDNIVAGLQSDKWDISLSLNDTPLRRQAITFSAPAVENSVDFAYNKNNPKFSGDSSKLSDVDKSNITVIVVSGSAADKAVSANMKHARIMRLPGFDDARLALMAKRGDVLADDELSNMLLGSIHKEWVKILKPDPVLAQQGIALGLRKDTPAEDISVLNNFIEGERNSGAVDKLLQNSVEATLAMAR